LMPGMSRFGMMWKVMSDGAASYQILYAASVVIGALMLNGAKAAWRYALILLGGYIVIQFTKLGQSFKHDKMSIVFFATNVALFFFIADQLVWKQRGPQAKKVAPPEMPKSSPAAVVPAIPRVSKSSKSKILVNLEGFGQWAQLIGVSGSGVHLRGIVETPPQLDGRTIEIALQPDLVLRVRFARQLDSEFHFDYVDLTSEQASRLNQWLHAKAA
jgi:hypothetical protein